jgi:D-3-phosphoglycerate dehydrogenase
MKDGVVLINCARGEIVDNESVISAAEKGKISKYVVDFPADELIGVKNVICIPHLGASTPEAEDNCAVMAAKELIDYIENGNIKNSVNYPTCVAPRNSKVRLTILHLNQQNMIAQFTTILADNKINIDNFVNSSKGNYAYSIIDIPEINDTAFEALSKIDGIIKIRKI